MRSKIRGLDQSVDNAKDAIGMIQTADGALTETHSMLKRMTTLATQAANGTYNHESRLNIQDEMDELGQEITRIANNTDYNGLKLLSDEDEPGHVDSATMQIGPTQNETLVVYSRDMTLSGIFKDITQTKSDTKDNSTNIPQIRNANGSGFGGRFAVLDGFRKINYDSEDKRNADLDAYGEMLENEANQYLKDNGYSGAHIEVSRPSDNYIGNPYGEYDIVPDDPNWVDSNGNPYIPGIGWGNYDTEMLKKDGVYITDAQSNDLLDIFDNMAYNDYYKFFGVSAPSSGSQTSVSNNNIRATGIPNEKYKGSEFIQIIEPTTGEPTSNANQVITNLQYAINYVSAYRAELGAKQNRLEHTLNNLSTTSENVTSAESRIRDTDMATEIASYLKNNVISQASMAMLAQSNQSAQSVLQLLQ